MLWLVGFGLFIWVVGVICGCGFVVGCLGCGVWLDVMLHGVCVFISIACFGVWLVMLVVC